MNKKPAIVIQPHTVSGLAVIEICNRVNIEVTEICSCSLCIASLLQRISPKLIIIDANKAETIHLLESTPPQIPKLVLSRYKEKEYILSLIRSHAMSICLKEQALSEIALAINSTNQGKRYLAPEVIDILVGAYRKDVEEEKARAKIKASLSQREIQILALLVKGYHNQEIADSLHLKRTTVKSYIEKIINKLNSRNRTHAATTALKLKIVIS